MHLNHDGSINIATGKSRKEKKWKNKEVTWSWLVERISTTHRTAESYDEYISSKKDRQDEIKDVGGFIGAYLTSGRKKATSVLNRQLITLDIDHIKNMDLWEDFKMMYDCAGAIYTTHKHHPEAPRMRLLIPIDRPVFSDEYVAIARKIAGSLDINKFDITTFEPSRMMYWPSTAKDGEFITDYQDGPWISADDLLNSYTDWKDVSEWPIAERSGSLVARSMKKQGDPLEKPGLIGAFCRVYSISGVIDKYLTDVYEPCDIEDRYTYKEGSTAAGLVVYEDKFAYSHHGTDPVSGKLCNAFDLVRIHEYGLKDEDAAEGTPPNKLPSYSAMMDLCTRDPNVRKQIGHDRQESAAEDFKDMDQDGETPREVGEMEVNQDGNIAEAVADDTWLEKLEIDKKGNYLSTINNVAIILENDPRLKGAFVTDEFRRKKLVLKNLPWRRVKPETIYLKDEDEQNLTKYLEKYYNIATRSNIKDAFDIHIAANGFHPIRDYLKGLEWDGLKRCESLLIEYLGAEDSPYTRTVTRKFLVAAVARVFTPGVKYDYVLTLVGAQGIGKSSIIGKLGGEWFSDSFNFNMLHTKEAYEQLIGAWLIEIGELNGMKKADVEAAKQFISKTEDTFRTAYGRNTTTFKRQCVFVGSTNNRDFLRDPTGNRRFWPVSTNADKITRDMWQDLDKEEINQIWAEAVELWKAGEKLYLTRDMEEVARKMQVQYLEIDDRVSVVVKYLDTLLPENWEETGLFERRAFLQGDELQAEGTVQRMKVCVGEVWCEALRGDMKDLTITKSKEIFNLLKMVEGWSESTKKLRFRRYGIVRAFIREKQ